MLEALTVGKMLGLNVGAVVLILVVYALLSELRLRQVIKKNEEQDLDVGKLENKLSKYYDKSKSDCKSQVDGLAKSLRKEIKTLEDKYQRMYDEMYWKDVRDSDEKAREFRFRTIEKDLEKLTKKVNGK